jgi:hypothetical protein
VADNTATEYLDLSNGAVYFEDSMEEHPEMRGLLDEINNDNDLDNENEQPNEARALGHYYHHKKHYKPYHYKKHHYKPYHYKKHYYGW